MKAIVNVSKKSAYAYLNGHTSTVKEVLFNGNSAPMFSLNIGGNTTDFTAKEVIVVNLKNGIILNVGHNTFLALNEYAKINKITM